MFAAVDDDRPLEIADHALGQLSDAVWSRYGRKQRCKLIPSESRDALAFVEAFSQPLAHDTQQTVAARVASRVIDALEVIEIEVQQATQSLSLLCGGYGRVYPLG